MNPIVFTDALAGENTYLIRYKNDVAVIDPGFNGEAVLAYLSEKGYALRMVLLTHGHYDHVRDLRVLQRTLAFPLYVHAADEALLHDDALNGSTYFRGSFRLKAGQEVVPLQDGAELPFGTDTIKVIHTPGHTQGSVCFLYRDCLFSGDTLFHGDLGRTDLAGGSARLLDASVLKLFRGLGEQVRVFPGHAEATTIAAERKANPEVVRILKSK